MALQLCLEGVNIIVALNILLDFYNTQNLNALHAIGTESGVDHFVLKDSYSL